MPKTTPVIQAFRQAGYEVAIDDFGTGYSNLHNLYSLNVDILKIDKSFIDTLTTNSTSHLIAEHIIEMAQSLRLKTIAEGSRRGAGELAAEAWRTVLSGMALRESDAARAFMAGSSNPCVNTH